MEILVNDTKNKKETENCSCHHKNSKPRTQLDFDQVKEMVLLSISSTVTPSGYLDNYTLYHDNVILMRNALMKMQN